MPARTLIPLTLIVPSLLLSACDMAQEDEPVLLLEDVDMGRANNTSNNTNNDTTETMAADMGLQDMSPADMGRSDMAEPDMDPPDMRPPDMGPPDMGPPDPCGNGRMDPGETCDGNCPRSCDDRNGCTEDVLMGDPDECTAECVSTPIAACDAYTGGYSGSYSIKTEEKLGSIVVNSMTCTGTFSGSVDVMRMNPLEGTAMCSYSGSLGGFARSQSATLTGSLSPDGSFTGRLLHDFGSVRDGSFTIDGSVRDGVLTVDEMKSYLPNAMSAVPWETTITFGAP